MSFRARAFLLGVTLIAAGSPPNAPAEPSERRFSPRESTYSVFPEPPALRPAVDFWRRVFAVWRLDQVALHDDRYLNVVYEVVDVPGTVGDSLMRAQKAYVEGRRLALARSLRELERRIRYGTRLNGEPQRLYAVIVRNAGRQAVMGASTRIRLQRGIRERFHRGVEISGRYERLLRQVFREARLPEDLACLPHIESSFINRAQSSAGAVGIWQFMPATGRRFLRMNRALDERYDPVLAARGAARYLRDAYRDLGDWGLAITSYNHGVGGMVRARRQFGGDLERILLSYHGRAFGFSSRNFYAEFLAARSILADLPRYFPEGIQFHPPLEAERVVLKRGVSVAHLARIYGVDRHELMRLNPAWSARATRGLVALPAGSDIWLPDGARSHSAYASADARPIGPQLPPIAWASRAPGRPRVHRWSDIALADAGLDGGSSRAGAPRVVKTEHRRGLRSGTPGRQRRTNNPARRLAERVHVVRKGESPYRVAARYGVSVGTLLKLNAMGRRAVMQPGQRLRIPARGHSKAGY
ncbi:MAG: transglycosylase SLT domain-containing protein [Gammaproteobacteria bacterium]